MYNGRLSALYAHNIITVPMAAAVMSPWMTGAAPVPIHSMWPLIEILCTPAYTTVFFNTLYSGVQYCNRAYAVNVK
jgi:hypothetical protein